MMAEQTMWVAVDARGRVQATWYRGCTQPFWQWREVVFGLGWAPIPARIKWRPLSRKARELMSIQRGGQAR